MQNLLTVDDVGSARYAGCHGMGVTSLQQADSSGGRWREMLVEDRTANPTASRAAPDT